MESGRIKANGDTEMALVAQDQFERDLGLRDSISRSGHQRARTDMDRQEGRNIVRCGQVSRRVGATS